MYVQTCAAMTMASQSCAFNACKANQDVFLNTVADAEAQAKAEASITGEF